MKLNEEGAVIGSVLLTLPPNLNTPADWLLAMLEDTPFVRPLVAVKPKPDCGTPN